MVYNKDDIFDMDEFVKIKLCKKSGVGKCILTKKDGMNVIKEWD